jgi:hypothetical protein
VETTTETIEDAAAEIATAEIAVTEVVIDYIRESLASYT